MNQRERKDDDGRLRERIRALVCGASIAPLSLEQAGTVADVLLRLVRESQDESEFDILENARRMGRQAAQGSLVVPFSFKVQQAVALRAADILGWHKGISDPFTRAERVSEEIARINNAFAKAQAETHDA